MSTSEALITTPTLIPAIIASAVFAVELLGVGFRYLSTNRFEPYVHLVNLAVIRTVGEIMKIVWTQTSNPSKDFIIATEIITKIGSVFVLLCVFRLLSYWIHSKVYYGQFPPPLLRSAIALGILIAVAGQAVGIFGTIEMMNDDNYSLGVTVRAISKGLLLAASVIYLGLTLINIPRARDPKNSFVLLLLGVIATVRATYDVVAIAVPSTSVVATSEIVQYLFDTLPEALAVAVAIVYNLSNVAYQYDTYLQQDNAMNDMYVENNSRPSYNRYEQRDSGKFYGYQ